MKKSVRLFLSLAALALLLAGGAGPARAAYIVPDELASTITALTFNYTTKTVSWKLYDPVKGQDVPETVTVTGATSVTSFPTSSGIVRFIANNCPSTGQRTLYYSTYDPLWGRWVTAWQTFASEYITAYTPVDGVFLYQREYDVSGIHHNEIEVRTYDPKGQTWRNGYWHHYSAGGDIYDVRVKGGAYAFRYASTSYPIPFVCFGIYNSSTQAWAPQRVDCTNNPTSLTIDNSSTVSFYDGPETNYNNFKRYGYGYDWIGWFWSLGAYTRPFAAFVAGPTAGNAPMDVWFLDLSWGGISWSWIFGNGEFSNTSRSLRYRYLGYDDYIAEHRLTGSGGVDSRTASITTDVTPPSGTIAINGGAAATKSSTVTLNLAAADNSNMVGGTMWLWNEGGTASSFPYSSTHTGWALPAGDGVKTVYARFFDAADNYSAQVSDTITVDTTLPTGSMAINGGVQYTKTADVTLNNAVSDATSGMSQMRFSNDNKDWSNWETYGATRPWKMATGDGTKTVYAQFSDNAGNVLPTSDTIILDSAAPTGSIAVTGPQGCQPGFTNVPDVTLNNFVSDASAGIFQMRFSNNNTSWSGWEPYAATKPWSLDPGDGAKTVYAQFSDNIGNVLSTSGAITLDTGKPTGTILVNNGDAYTNNRTVNLTITGQDGGSGVFQMCFSPDNDSWSSWEPFSTTKTYNLPNWDYVWSVFMKLKDRAGNVSELIFDGIVLDMTPPIGCGLTVNGGNPYTKTATVPIVLSVTEANLDKIRVSDNNFASYTEYTALGTQNFTLTGGGDGERTLVARYLDKASNQADSPVVKVTLDTAAPAGTIAINNGSQYVNNTGVTVNPAASDSGSGLDKVRLSNDNVGFTEFAYGASIPWTLTAGDGTKTVYAQFTDKAGNTSGSVNATITLDTAAPTNGSIAINGGAAYTQTAAVTLALSATDALSGLDKVQVSNDNFATFSELAYNAILPWTLAAGDGAKTVSVKFQDKAGNLSTPVSAGIILDGTAPKDGTLSAAPGNKQVKLTWTAASDAGSGLQAYRLYYSASGYPTPATGAKIYEGPALTFTHLGLTNGKPCYYRLVAVDKVGNVSAGVTATGTPRAGGLPWLDLLLGD